MQKVVIFGYGKRSNVGMDTVSLQQLCSKRNKILSNFIKLKKNCDDNGDSIQVILQIP
jgi:hypothetical protein